MDYKTEDDRMLSPEFAFKDFRDVNPEVWFALFEIELRKNGVVTDEGKFSHLVSRLPKDMITVIRNVIQNPPEEGKYELGKKLILQELLPADYRRLLSLKLDDRKPSVLLREMRLAAGYSNLSEAILQELWLKCLPVAVQAILAAVSSRCTLNELAVSADAIYERLPRTNTSISLDDTCNVASKDARTATPYASNPTNPDANAIAHLQRELESLRRMLNRVSLRSRSRSRKPSTRSRSYSRTRSKMCWYHFTYGDKARNCKHWCAEHAFWLSRNM